MQLSVEMSLHFQSLYQDVIFSTERGIPTGCKDDEGGHFYREMHPYRDAKRADGVFLYQELKKKYFFNELMPLMDILG
jgi:hypothetical protein